MRRINLHILGLLVGVPPIGKLLVHRSLTSSLSPGRSRGATCASGQLSECWRAYFITLKYCLIQKYIV